MVADKREGGNGTTSVAAPSLLMTCDTSRLFVQSHKRSSVPPLMREQNVLGFLKNRLSFRVAGPGERKVQVGVICSSTPARF